MMRPPVQLEKSRHNGKPQAVSAPAPSLVPTDEAIEDARQKGRRYAGPAVRHGERDSAPGGANPDVNGHIGIGMEDHVFAQDAQAASQVGRVSASDRKVGVRIPRHRPRTADSSGVGLESCDDIVPAQSGYACISGISGGESEEISHDVIHAVNLGQGFAKRLAPRSDGHPGMAEDEFDVGANGGEGRAQIMGRVSHEFTLTGNGSLFHPISIGSLVERLIQGGREVVEVVASPGQGQSRL